VALKVTRDAPGVQKLDVASSLLARQLKAKDVLSGQPVPACG
jgi:hypothetical protein